MPLPPLALRTLTCCLLLASAALAEQEPDASADPSDAADVARQHFTKALAHVDEGAFGLAVSEFEQAYRAHPHPNVLYNLGLAYARAGDPIRAIEALERHLAEVDEDAARREAVQAVLDQERAKTGQVTVLTSPREARVRIGDRELAPSHDEPTRLLPGDWTIAVESDGYQPSTLSLTLGPNEHRLVQIALAPDRMSVAASATDKPTLNESAMEPTAREKQEPAFNGGRTRTLGYLTAATGLATIATGVGFYVLSSNTFETWQERQGRLDDEWRRGQPYASDLEDRQHRNDDLARDVAAQDRWALGLGVGGGVLLAVSLPLLLLLDPETPALEARGDRLIWRMTW